MTSGKSFTCALLATLTLALVCRAADEPRVLTRVADIRALSREEAAKALPVRLRGVVIWQDASPDPAFFVHDGQLSVYVDSYGAFADKVWQGGKLSREDCAPGSLIELEGITDPGRYSPCIKPVRFQRIGTAPLPEARHTTVTTLMAGIEDGQRVEVKGILQDLTLLDKKGRFWAVLMVGGYPCHVVIENGEGLDAGRLVDATVRVRGCASPVFNLRAEAISIRLKCQGAADIDVVSPAPADPFAATHLPLQRLLQFSLSPQMHHRKVTQGTVNFALPGHFFFIQDGTTGVRVDSSADSVEVGDRVEVAAFVNTTRTLASMKNAIVRKVGHGPLPPPLLVSGEEILHPSRPNPLRQTRSGDYSGRVVQISGILQKLERDAGGAVQTLFIRSGDVLFQAHLPQAAGATDPVWQEGSRVELAGVCELQFNSSDITRSLAASPVIRDLPGVIGFDLWLRSPQDVRILSVPSWWTVPRLMMTLIVTLLVLALVLGWVGLLRLQVRRQLALIGDKLQIKAVDVERNRVARDLHDSLEQNLAGVALHLEGAERSIGQDPATVAESVSLARHMLRHTRMEARRSVWDLRSQILEREGLGAALLALAKSSTDPSILKVEVEINGLIRPLPPGADFHLLRIAQEALGNVLKHACASSVVISLEYQPLAVRLSVRDDGQGFDPAAPPPTPGAHFGLLGMRERAIRIGAEFTITAAPGAGCCITVILPCAPATEAEAGGIPLKEDATALDPEKGKA